MKIIVLSDNRQDAEKKFVAEHGLSIFLKLNGKQYLIDTGNSDLFYKNALLADVDIAAIDYLIITHPHHDHIGGLNTFLEHNTKAKIIISAQAFKKEYYSFRRHKGADFIGFDCQLDNEQLKRFIFVDKTTDIDNLFTAHSSFTDAYPKPRANKFLFTRTGGKLKNDIFDHEIAVSFKHQEQLIIFVGCAHNGLLNMLSSINEETSSKKIALVVGGFHLRDKDDRCAYESAEEIESIAKSITTEYPETQFYTGHCTGDKACEILKNTLAVQLEIFHTGFKIEA